MLVRAGFEPGEQVGKPLGSGFVPTRFCRIIGGATCTHGSNPARSNLRMLATLSTRRDLRPTDSGLGLPISEIGFPGLCFPVFRFDLKTEIRYEDACSSWIDFDKRKPHELQVACLGGTPIS